MPRSAIHLESQPRPRGLPQTLYVAGRLPENPCTITDRKAREETQIDELRGLQVAVAQAFERGAQCSEISGSMLVPLEEHIHLESFAVRSPSYGLLRPCVVHQHAPHRGGRDAKEVSLVLPITAPHQAQASFADQRRHLQSVMDRLTRHEMASHHA